MGVARARAIHPRGTVAGALDLPWAAVRLTPGEVIVEASDAFCADLGLNRNEVLGRCVSDLIASRSDRVETLGGAPVYAFGPEGREIWRRLDRRDDMALLVDVTHEIRAYRHVRSEFMERARLLHDAEVGTWRYDPDTETYYFSSELALGYDAAAEPTPLALLRQIQHRDDQDLDDSIRDRLTREGGSAEAELRFIHGRKGWRHLRVMFRTGRRLPSGRYEMYGLSQNVTALAHARDQAGSLAERLKLALTGAGAGVFEYDFKKARLWVSSELQALSLGVIDGETKDPEKIFHSDDLATARAVFAYEGDTPPPPAEVRLMRPDGPLWTRLTWRVERDATGAPTRGVGLLLNIDLQKRQELALHEARRSAEAATAAKSNFLASVSHEIRTPMNGIVGVLHLLEREGLSPEGRDLLAEALACSDMLSQLINDVLDFSKMEAGKLDITPASTDPNAVMESVVALLNPQADAKNLYLRTRPCAPGFALIDPVRLRQCLFNVIGNAVKFTADGGVEVRLSWIGDGQARRLRCEVQDTGVGVPEDAKESLFDRFSQADNGANRKFGGTGLGLAISRSLSRMMGGDMGFESTQGQGSLFWFELQAPACAPAELVATEESSLEPPLAGLRVLLVDDNRTNRMIGLKTLQSLGAEAETADSGEAAIEAVATSDFDLVLMDINMPGMDGMEATRRIRDLFGPAAEVTIIALTADVMSHHQRAYQAAGMNGFVPKPVAPYDLLTEIMRLTAD